MRIPKNNDQRSALFWFLVGLILCLGSWKYEMGSFSSPGPGFLPLLVGLTMAALAVVVFLQAFTAENDILKSLWVNTNWFTVITVMAALILYAVLFKFLGFLLDTFLLLVFLLKAAEPMRWKTVVFWAAAFATGSYTVFHVWLEAQLPKGILGF
jgi:hypothetical protein